MVLLYLQGCEDGIIIFASLVRWHCHICKATKVILSIFSVYFALSFAHFAFGRIFEVRGETFLQQKLK